jgi:hypothetical protein
MQAEQIFSDAMVVLLHALRGTEMANVAKDTKVPVVQYVNVAMLSRQGQSVYHVSMVPMNGELLSSSAVLLLPATCTTNSRSGHSSIKLGSQDVGRAALHGFEIMQVFFGSFAMLLSHSKDSLSKGMICGSFWSRSGPWCETR